MNGTWVAHDVRDAVMDFVNDWSDKTEIAVGRFIGWLGIGRSKFYNWHARYGKANEHNGKIPRDFWLEDWEKQAIIAYHLDHHGEGYRRLTFMMLDADVVAAGPTSVWRVLHDASMLNPWNGKESKKGTGFVQPLSPHNTGKWMSLISIFAGRFTTCAACSTDAAATSPTGRSARR